MDRLWAPWRMEYIMQPKGDTTCIFCTFPKEKQDRNNLLLYRSEHCFVIFNRYPYNNGHLMVVPYMHCATPEGLELVQQTNLHNILYQSIGILRDACNPQGFNIGLNLGSAAGAGIDEHCHYHIVPRWNGDTNFMPVMSDTRVIPEHLLETYDKFEPLFRKLAKV